MSRRQPDAVPLADALARSGSGQDARATVARAFGELSRAASCPPPFFFPRLDQTNHVGRHPGLARRLNPFTLLTLRRPEKNMKLRAFVVDSLVGFWFLRAVMQKTLRKIVFACCIVGFVSVLTVPAEAGRSAGPPPPIIIIPKPVTSLP